MRLKKALEDKKMDVRFRDNLVSEGKMTQSEIKEYLMNLPDESGNFAYTDAPAEDSTGDSGTNNNSLTE